MTNVGLLSTKFESLTETLRAFNDGVIVLKKKLYEMPGSESISDQKVIEHSTIITAFLKKALSAINDSTSYLSDDDIAVQIVVENLREKRKGDIEDLVEEIEQTIQQLESSWHGIGEEDLRLLDSICWLIDSEASLTFRRIWKR